MADLDGLVKWFGDRPKWLQECAMRIVEKVALQESDYAELLALCKSEAEGLPVENRAISRRALEAEDTTKELRVESIADVSGVNAVRSTAPVVFGSGAMTIVYGRNGSGKSGYVRLLKQASGARSAGQLLPDVFKREQEEPHATITFEDDGELI